MNLDTFPGNLGPVRGTLLTAIHADWPAYPEGDGSELALLHLSAFAPKTVFLQIDDIDQCMLFVADKPLPDKEDKFSDKNLHIAIWHEDLLKLSELGWISGAIAASSWEWKETQWKRILQKYPDGLCYQDLNGQIKKVPPPVRDEEEDPVIRSLAICPDQRIEITASGRDHVRHLIETAGFNVAEEVSQRVAKLLELGFYDCCIREACVTLEHEMKLFTGSNAFGERLVEDFVNSIPDDRILESFQRTYRQHLRTTFKLIRNRFMHNLVVADVAEIHVLLFRIARVRSFLTQLVGMRGQMALPSSD